MRRNKPTLAATAVSLGLFLAGCSDADVAPEGTSDTIEDVADDARQRAEEAFASLRTDAERVVDELQTEQAPQAKDELLERCRDALERLREADSEATDRVGQICDRIRDTDVSDADAFNTIRQEINEIEVN